MTKMGYLIMRNSKHVKATRITLEQYLRDQLSKDSKADTLQDMIKQFEDKILTVTKVSHDTQTANMKTGTVQQWNRNKQ